MKNLNLDSFFFPGSKAIGRRAEFAMCDVRCLIFDLPAAGCTAAAALPGHIAHQKSHPARQRRTHIKNQKPASHERSIYPRFGSTYKYRGIRSLFFFLFALPTLLPAQTAEELAAVQAPIQLLFDGMRAGDSSMVRRAFHPGARLQTAFVGRDGQPRLEDGQLGQFLQSVGTPHEKVFNEQIWSYDIRIDGLLATAWTEYTFFLGDQLSHCGVNAFQLFRGAEGWKISHIADTRRREGCPAEAPDEAALINGLLDNWHRAAATAHEEAFFGSMTADAIYLGTDASERWLRDELRDWAKAAFERDTAWAFTPHSRQLYFAQNGQTAWFEEKLDTWMGPCRGSGVLAKTADGWKIRHYNLAVLVPNEKIQAFIELVKG
ncbi:MAG: nuclear transport factor 2 family protein [Lewinellaceae bacterium]|nr:nuclear transport factor 2 family protein [Lewinellaceae bacterium]